MTLPLPYINWREMPGLPGAKPRKVPWSAASDTAIDPHDAKNHLTADQARATGLPIGVVLSAADPYFLLDLDDCALPDGSWHPDVVAICAGFPGAAIEISHNGKGLHVMGRCDAAALGPRRHKFRAGSIACEFYTEGRFVALGRGFTGSIEHDWTSVLDAWVPRVFIANAVVLSDVAVAEYTGPESDDDLIAMMLAAHGSAGQVFGAKATVAELWNADAAALARHFPSSSGQAFDHSNADAALMQHLAFYTGKNAARMDRLFRRSGLMRDKYAEREDYRQSTISGAVARCSKVYDKPRSPASLPPQSVPAGATAQSAPLMSVQEQMTFFQGCVYVMSDHAIMIPGGDLLKPAQFKAVYGGHEFIISPSGGKSPSTLNAFEAFTENRVVAFPKVRRTRFKPQLPHGELVGDGVNVYQAPEIRTERGDVTPFLDLLRKLLPVEHDREVLLAWMASLVQNQGKKFLWSPVVQGTQGNAKSMIGKVLHYCIGERYSYSVRAKKIDAQFNSFLRNRIFINVEEMHMFQKYELLDTLKDYITGDRMEVERKGVDAEMDTDYCANWFFTTNHRDAIIKERNDRRFAVFFTAQQSREDMVRDGMLSDGYFPRLWDWLRADGFARLRGYLLDYRVPAALDPAGDCTMAPVTSSTEIAIEESYGAAEQHIFEAIASDKPGFRGGWISTWAASQLLQNHGIKRAPRKLGQMLQEMGYERRDRASKPLPFESNERPVLYALPGVQIEYAVAQGYETVRLRTA